MGLCSAMSASLTSEMIVIQVRCVPALSNPILSDIRRENRTQTRRQGRIAIRFRREARLAKLLKNRSEKNLFPQERKLLILLTDFRCFAKFSWFTESCLLRRQIRRRLLVPALVRRTEHFHIFRTHPGCLLSQRAHGPATCGPASCAVGCQAAFSVASLWAVEVWTLKVRTTGAVSSRCCTVFCTTSNCSRS